MTSYSKKILVVEDETPLLKAIVAKLSYEGFEVLEAHDGNEGLEIAIKNKPDMILLDIIMPVRDGLSMLEELRKDEWGKTALVMLLTNLNSSDQVAVALQFGVEDYLVKSDLKLQEIVRQIKAKFGITT